MLDRDSTVTTTAPPPNQRSFGKKYKTDDYAKYYSNKHESSLARRVSNFFERQMVKRALTRISRQKPFQTVLDCPSGTGRFLPTLSSFNVSVVTMDTSDQMLQQGRKHFSLFDASPTPAAGSAFELPLSDDAVDVVLCSRLLHHIPDQQAREKILRELARVARVGVVISFFDSASYRAWKRRNKTQRTGKPSGRIAISRSQCEEEAISAGLKPIGMNALFRFHAEVTTATFLVD